MAMEDWLHPWLGAYTASPQWVKNSVGRAYSMVPVSMRRGRHYQRFMAEAALTSQPRVRQLAARKLAATLVRAIDSVPAYRPYRSLLDQFDQPLDILRKLPTVSKEEIRRDPESYLSADMPPRLRMRVFTGGSTSTPMAFFLHKGISRTKEYAFMECFHQRAGLRGRELVLALRGRTVPTAALPSGPCWMLEPIKHQLILSSDHLARPWMPEHIETLRRWQPVHIQAYPSALHPLCLWLKEFPAPDVTRRIQSIMLFSENVFDSHLALLREVFDCPVLRQYGHSERVLAAASMPDDDRYFFWPQYGHFELLDESGNPITQPGIAGEIVGTSFDNLVMPFVRYRTGDMAVLSARGHPLLPGYPAVERIEGRRQEYVVCGDGRLVSINSLGVPKYKSLEGVEAIQYEQWQPGHLVLKVASATPLSDQARNSLRHALEAKLQGSCQANVIDTRKIDRTPSGKLQMLVQHLEITEYFEKYSQGTDGSNTTADAHGKDKPGH